LHVLQPTNLKAPVFLEELLALKADLQVVVAFRMLPEVVWNMPRMGTINLHGSLLPKYRGAAPINWAIINGEKVTGVTTFKLQHKIDTGDILLQERIDIGDNETAGELHDRMKEIGGELLVKTVKGVFEGTIKEVPQSDAIDELKFAPKIFTDNCRIDWHRNIDEVHNLIRGLSPYPGACTSIKDKTLKIYSGTKEYTEPTVPFGHYLTDKKTYLKFACEGGYISINELQLEGKKRIKIEEFLRGYHF
jgi:methionyl-tRNA formyltransferase